MGTDDGVQQGKRVRRQLFAAPGDMLIGPDQGEWRSVPCLKAWIVRPDNG
jgi:hypothetical protein